MLQSNNVSAFRSSPQSFPIHYNMLSPTIISHILKTFLIPNLTALSHHSKNIPSVFSDLIFRINASFGVSKHSMSSALCTRLLSHSANAYAASNFHLCLLYSRNHRSILPFVWGLFRFDGMCLTPRAFRYCSNQLTPLFFFPFGP